MEERIQIHEVELLPDQLHHIFIISERGPFRPLNLIVPEGVAKNFVISDIQVGRNSQFMSANGVPADYFAQRGDLEDLLMDKLPRGMTLRISVLNTSPSPAKFSAVMRGVLEGDNIPREPPPQDRYIMGLATNLIPSGTTFVSQSLTQVPLKPDCLVLPGVLAGQVLVKSIRIAGVELAMTIVHPSLITFPPTILNISDWLVVEVEVKTPDRIRFGGAVVGAQLGR